MTHINFLPKMLLDSSIEQLCSRQKMLEDELTSLEEETNFTQSQLDAVYAELDRRKRGEK